MEVVDIASLTPKQRTDLDQVLAELIRRSKMRKLSDMFPDSGPVARHLYPKHLAFFEAGRSYQIRAFIAANRVGKTEGCGTEWSYHLTGDYPHWWVGHRFDKPIRLMVSGDTHETTRDILQVKLLGATTDRAENFGTGLIPGRAIKSYVKRQHVPGAVEKAYIRHASGGESEVIFRSYEQGREIFQGVELDGFWPDEECPLDVFEEGTIRLMTTGGLCTITFTPLSGLTELIQHLMGESLSDIGERGFAINQEAGIFLIQCGWEDVPHLDAETKKRLYAALPVHQRDARTRGIPSLGAGAIYPVAEEEITCADFEIPAYWPRGYGMDVGWNRTAAVFLAHDRDNDILYAYGEHYRGQAEPAVHAQAIRARGDWMRGAIDPASRGRSQTDGQQLFANYKRLGLNLTLANNAVEAGIHEVWTRLSTGRLKIFKSCQQTLSEYRIYHRDDKGKVVKKSDHAMDALRYAVNTLQVLKQQPNERANSIPREVLVLSAPLDPGMGF